MTKPEIIAKLQARNLGFDPAATIPQLKEILKNAPVAPLAGAVGATPTASPAPSALPPAIPTPPTPSTEDLDGIEVGDPQELRPVELPLVIKPSGGKDWKNDAQAQYAKTLNGYAYKNPKKWAKKKGVLIARLAEVGNDPSALKKYEANDGTISFNDKRFDGAAK